MRNNILINESARTGTGRTVVLRRTTSGLLNFATGSDNNILYAGTPGTWNNILYGATAYQTLAEYQTHVAPREANSHSEDPPFVNVSTQPYDLHMQTTVTDAG